MPEMFRTSADFEAWLQQMESELRDFLGALPPDVSRRLDFSPGSLDVLEAWLLGSFKSPRDLLQPAQLRLWDQLGRYIGETFRRVLGGRWEAVLDNAMDVCYRMPHLTGFSRKPTPVDTHALATATIHRRKGDYLRPILENTVQHEAKWK